MPKYLPIFLGIVLLVILTFLSSIAYFFHQNQSGPSKPKMTRTKTPSNRFLPPVTNAPETSTASNVYTVVPGSSNKIRLFNLIIRNYTLSSTKLAVNQGDVVNIRLTADDNKYDLTFTDFGVRQETEKGETKTLEFQAVSAGSYDFSCRSCLSVNPTAKGVLLVVPRPTP